MAARTMPIHVPDEDHIWSLTSIGVVVFSEDHTWSLTPVGVLVSSEDNIWLLSLIGAPTLIHPYTMFSKSRPKVEDNVTTH